MKYLFAIILILSICEAKFLDVIIVKNTINIQRDCFAYIAYEYDKLDTAREFLVRDFDSGKIINPFNAFFVLGSNLKTSCSKYSVVAFENENSANFFIKKYGGDLRDFDFALFVAKKDLELDGKIIEFRTSNSAKRGKEIYEKYCKKNIKNCQKLSRLNKNDLEYFLQNQNLTTQENKIEQIKVPLDAKCPVCGMFVIKYPKWAANIVTNKGHTHYFDGVKDMMKFYFEPSKFHHNHSQAEFTKLYVTDYYSLEMVDAKKCFFVFGSNIFGPMGHELIPFKNEIDAIEFSKFHSGKAILKFNSITKQIVYGLD